MLLQPMTKQWKENPLRRAQEAVRNETDLAVKISLKTTRSTRKIVIKIKTVIGPKMTKIVIKVETNIRMINIDPKMISTDTNLMIRRNPQVAVTDIGRARMMKSIEVGMRKEDLNRLKTKEEAILMLEVQERIFG